MDRILLRWVRAGIMNREADSALPSWLDNMSPNNAENTALRGTKGDIDGKERAYRGAPVEKKHSVLGKHKS